MADREDYIFEAKLAEETGRYDEMAKAMMNVAYLDIEMTEEERNMLSTAYKSKIGPKRTSWRIISSIEQSEQSQSSEKKLKIIKEHRAKIEAELSEICEEILLVLKHLIPMASTEESKVFYIKMQGDYLRYLAEFATGDDQKEAAKKSFDAYCEANDIAKAELAATNPVRLLLALNFSVLLYEVSKDPECAFERAQNALDDALAELDSLKGEDHKSCTVILQMIQDNLTLWKSEQEQEVEGGGSKQKKATAKSEVGLSHKKT